ncbi:MAG: discoidin domain-containing protein [Thermoanaerobaculia bacterium]|nr:discoidin domain-containing protein [Thermoanaerobaculia bacterium]
MRFAIAVSALGIFQVVGAQNGSISASPNPCAVPVGGTCSASISWTTGGTSLASIWVEADHSGPIAPVLFAQGTSGSQGASWIQTGNYLFVLRNGSAQYGPELARVTVTGATQGASLEASPQSCAVPSAGTCGTTLTWSTAPAVISTVWVESDHTGPITPRDVAQGTSGSASISWIQIGTYAFVLRQGTASSGIELARTTVTGTSSTPVNPYQAEFVGASISTTMQAGAQYTAQLTFRNVGTDTWTSSGAYRLGSQNPQDNQVWGSGRVELPHSVSPGQSVTFTFQVAAPSTPGQYNFQWKMLREMVTWFGQPSTNQVIDVQDATPTPPGNGEIQVPTWSLGATASSSYPGLPPSLAVDGNSGTQWSAGNFPVQWIQVDVGQTRYLTKVRLLVSQFPNGATTHEVWAGDSEAALRRISVISGPTVSPQWLEARIDQDARFVRIVTTSSPSWVGWFEIVPYELPGPETYDQFIPLGRSVSGSFQSDGQPHFWSTVRRTETWTDVHWGNSIEEFEIRRNCFGGEDYVWLNAYRDAATGNRWGLETTKALVVDHESGVATDITSGGACGRSGQPYAKLRVGGPYTMKVWMNMFRTDGVTVGRRVYWQATYSRQSGVLNSCWVSGGSNFRPGLRQDEAWWDRRKNDLTDVWETDSPTGVRIDTTSPTYSGWAIGAGTLGTPATGLFAGNPSYPEPTGLNVVNGRWGVFGKRAGWAWDGRDTHGQVLCLNSAIW